MFGERLKELRASKSMKQSDVAKCLGISRQAYSKYETEDHEPSYEILNRIADFYNVSVDYILGRTDIKNINDYTYLQSFKQIFQKSNSKIIDAVNIFTFIIEKNSNNKKVELLNDYLKLFNKLL